MLEIVHVKWIKYCTFFMIFIKYSFLDYVGLGVEVEIALLKSK